MIDFNELVAGLIVSSPLLPRYYRIEKIDLDNKILHCSIYIKDHWMNCNKQFTEKDYINKFMSISKTSFI